MDKIENKKEWILAQLQIINFKIEDDIVTTSPGKGDLDSVTDWDL